MDPPVIAWWRCRQLACHRRLRQPAMRRTAQLATVVCVLLAAACTNSDRARDARMSSPTESETSPAGPGVVGFGKEEVAARVIVRFTSDAPRTEMVLAVDQLVDALRGDSWFDLPLAIDPNYEEGLVVVGWDSFDKARDGELRIRSVLAQSEIVASIDVEGCVDSNRAR